MENFKIKQRVVYENMDFEVVIINFNTGDYYSLRQLAMPIWLMLEKQATSEQMIQALSQYYAMENEHVKADLTDFLLHLKSEDLIEENLTDIEMQNADELIKILQSTVGDNRVYMQPLMVCYSDINDLLMLDPIHDVDSTGWPSQVTADSTMVEH